MPAPNVSCEGCERTMSITALVCPHAEPHATSQKEKPILLG